MNPQQKYAATNPLTGRETPDDMGGYVRLLVRHDGTVMHVATTMHYCPTLHPYLPVWHARVRVTEHGVNLTTPPVRGVIERACIAALLGVGEGDRELWAYDPARGVGDLRVLSRPDEQVGYGYPVHDDHGEYGVWRQRHALAPSPRLRVQ